MEPSTIKPFLMGSETEFSVSGQRDGRYLEPDEVYELIEEIIQEERAFVPDDGGYRGMYLQHGGRLYLDYGSHPEHATPECFTPRQVACYDKAGEHLLRLASTILMDIDANLRINVVKNNLDPVDPDQVSFGTHESYTCWVTGEVAGPQLLPHLVTRILYAGSGGLSGHREGIGFELSQRARHLMQATGHDTTNNRAIFSTRVRKDSDYSSDGWVRVHLIGKDSQRAPFGIYLTYATTGLLIEMLNRGYKVGQGLALAESVSALRKISRDPWLKVQVPLADGRKMTALEIQFAYLEECERAVQHGGMPEWAPEAVRHWRETLADLARDPLRLADRLDPYCKLLIYQHELRRAQLDWADLRQALGRLTTLRDRYPEEVVHAVVSENPTRLEGENIQAYKAACTDFGVGRCLDQLRFAIRLQALDINYHELGGLYDRLHDAGRIRNVILQPEDIERASLEPPSGGRAGLRGEWIRNNRDPGWRGDWQYVWQITTGRCLDLRNPFSGERRVVQLPKDRDGDHYRYDVLDLLLQPEAIVEAP
jgi:hypothetical protein